MEPVNKPIRILAVDDHPVFLHGLAALIRTQTDMELIAEARDGRQAITEYAAHLPDVTLMDLRLPDMHGTFAVRAIRSRFRNARIIVLTTYGGAAQVASAVRAGALGFLLKTSIRRELVEAIYAVHAGQLRFPPDQSGLIAQHSGHAPLTHREIEVLFAAAEGYSNRDIGLRLGISEETVKSQISSILVKLNAKDRTHAVVIAIDRGYL